MDLAKLAELRAKQQKERKELAQKRHIELVDKNNELIKAVQALQATINGQEPLDTDLLVKQLSELSNDKLIAKQYEQLNKALESSKTSLDKLLTATKDNKPVDNLPVITKALNKLAETISKQTHSQEADDFVPMRRVRKIGNRFQFDDDPLKVNVAGGSAIPSRLIEDDKIKVQVDGLELGDIDVDIDKVGLENIAGDKINPATEGKQDNTITELQAIKNNQLANDHDVTVTNSDFPLPAAQISTLTPQTNALTDTELRATPLDIDTTGLATEAKQDSIVSAINNIGGATDEASRIATDSGDSDLTYIGKAPIGSANNAAVWKISRLDTSSIDLDKRFADGGAYSQVWDNREGLSYV